MQACQRSSANVSPERAGRRRRDDREPVGRAEELREALGERGQPDGQRERRARQVRARAAAPPPRRRARPRARPRPSRRAARRPAAARRRLAEQLRRRVRADRHQRAVPERDLPVEPGQHGQPGDGDERVGHRRQLQVVELAQRAAEQRTARRPRDRRRSPRCAGERDAQTRRVPRSWREEPVRAAPSAPRRGSPARPASRPRRPRSRTRSSAPARASTPPTSAPGGLSSPPSTAAVKPKTSTASKLVGATKTAGATSTPASEPPATPAPSPSVNIRPDAHAEQPRDLGRERRRAHLQAERRCAGTAATSSAISDADDQHGEEVERAEQHRVAADLEALDRERGRERARVAAPDHPGERLQQRRAARA